MNYWLLCLKRPDIEHCMKVGTFGLSRKFILGQVCKADKVVCCAGKGDWKVIGLGECTSDYYIDDKPVFLSDGIYPDRFNFESKHLLADQELDLMSIIDQLSFVKDLAYWAVFFRNGVVKLNKSDWDLISKSVGSTRTQSASR